MNPHMNARCRAAALISQQPLLVLFLKKNKTKNMAFNDKFLELVGVGASFVVFYRLRLLCGSEFNPSRRVTTLLDHSPEVFYSPQ